MTNCIADKPRLLSPESKAFKQKNASDGSLPPGQRLMRYVVLSSLLIFGQAGWLPIDKPSLIAVGSPVIGLAPMSLVYSLDELKRKLQLTSSSVKNVHPGVFVVDPVDGRYVDLNGRMSFSAASIIKLPILVALLVAMENGKVEANAQLEIRQDLVTGGSGHLQWRPIGTKVAVRDVAELMMIVSDNTATNMIIDLLGGKDNLNQQFVSWGLSSTKINNLLGDFEGTNKTSPYDLVYLLDRINRGDIISPKSRDWMLRTMERTRIKTLLPQGLGPGAKIAHKTGDIGSMVGDAGIVTTPNGAKYIVCVQVERQRNDRRANLLIRSLSKMIYRCFTGDAKSCEDMPAEVVPPLGAAPASHRHKHGRARYRHT